MNLAILKLLADYPTKLLAANKMPTQNCNIQSHRKVQNHFLNPLGWPATDTLSIHSLSKS